jgi:protein-S-isoprenylcysteine O-methyltransferase Ste14
MNSGLITGYFGLAGFLLWGIIERWFHFSGHHQVEGVREDKGTYWLISIAWYGAILVSILDAFYTSWTSSTIAFQALRWIGIPWIIIGLIARVAARVALGQQYSVRVETSQNHQLVTDGVYGVLRHPAYLGTLCLMIGIPLSLGSIPGLGIAFIAGIPTLLYRIRIEESTLANRFGQAYHEYAQSTWRIIPFLW